MNIVKLLHKNFENPIASIRSIVTMKSDETNRVIAKVGVFNESEFKAFAKSKKLNYTRVSAIEFLIIS